MVIFKVAYWLGLVMQIVIRAPYRQMTKHGVITDRRVSSTEKTLLALLSVFGLVFPGLYTFSSWLAFADYALPGWTAWLGLGLLAASLLVFWRSHADLKANWSPSLEIRADHTLVTGGIYSRLRHPMYASQFLFTAAQSLLMPNWLAGLANLAFFSLFYLLRAPAEERMMVERFGEEYRAYQGKTGSLLPKIRL